MKFFSKKQLKLVPSPKRFTTAVILLIIGIAIIDAVFVGVSNDLRSRSYLVGRASTIAASLSVDDIKALQGNEKDLKNPAYSRLKDRLAQLKQENDDARFLYLMGSRESNVYFMVDSEQADSMGYSPPGQIYPEASQRLKDEFQSYTPFNEGPVKDSFGYWVSTIAPVVDPKNNRVVAVVGIDIPAQKYYWQIVSVAAVPLLLAAIPVAGLLRDRKLQKKEWEISNLKSQFVSVASHELRSPLTGMLWAIQTLLASKDSNLNDKQKLLLQDMYRSTEFSVATINEILDLSIFERGKNLRAANEPVDLTGVLRDAQNTLKLGAQEKNIDVVMAKTWPDYAPTEGDTNALKRAFMNIISNGIKYSPDASTVTIAYRQENNEHIVAVLDQGIGIPKDEQGKVFGGYHRAANAAKTQVRGTGLGLFITKLIIEEHHGRIWLESEENKGTTIYVALPVKDMKLAKKPTEAKKKTPDQPKHQESA